MQAALNVPQPTTSATVPFLLSPERYNDDSESRSSASEYTMDRHLQAADEEIENSDPVDDVAPLPGATKQKPLWHYKRSTEMCASLASLESMGMCVVDSGHVRFDLARSYASPTNGASPPSPTGDGLESPSRIESFDSLSDLAGNSNTFSRNGSSNSIGSSQPSNNSTQHPLLPSSLPQHHSTHHHRSPTHHICGSIDSGYSYDNSIDISSLTDSSHTGMNDSLFTGPRFSVGLNASHHCNPEHSNIFMNPSSEFSEESKTPVEQGSPVKLPSHHVEADESLRDELQQTAMKRQESDASYVSSTAVRPPTTYRGDTLDSNGTPVGRESEVGGSEGGGGDCDTLTRRRRSGAFSFHGRSSHASGDSSTLDSRTSSTKDTASLERDGTLPRSALEVKKLVKQRRRQVAGVMDGEEEGEEEEEEDEDVFSHFSKSPDPQETGRNGIWGQGSRCNEDVCPAGVSPCPPDVRVSCSPPEVRVSCSPPSLPSCWLGGDSDPELAAITTGTCPVSGRYSRI